MKRNAPGEGVGCVQLGSPTSDSGAVEPRGKEVGWKEGVGVDAQPTAVDNNRKTNDCILECKCWAGVVLCRNRYRDTDRM